jgi:dihydroorotase
MAEMSLLLKNCVVFDILSSVHKEPVDILIDRGEIQSIGTNLKADKVVDLQGGIVSPGWVDMYANFCDPGFEHREQIASGIQAALAGGYCSVGLLPNTNPVVDTKSDVEYILSKSKDGVSLMPYAAVSEGTLGENMTEMLDLSEAGAWAFTDGHRAIHNSELLLKALQYLQKINGLIISRAKDPHLSRNAQMHEGKASTILGMRGEPSLSEKIQIATQLEILRYAGGRIHFTMVSSEEGLKLIRNAKKEGLRVTCDVGINHLYYCDEDVQGFDTRFKVEPPFRSENDRKALIKGVNDGTVDAIVSGHEPHDREGKYLEFDLAEPGIISLQTAYSVLVALEKELDMGKAFAALTIGPRKILDIEPVAIEVGSPALFSVFDPSAKWTLDATTNKSKSRNSPFWGKELQGKSLGIIRGTKMWSA